MKYKTHNITENRTFVEIEDLFCHQYKILLDRVRTTTALKIGHTLDTWQKRTYSSKFWDIFSGDLAKALVVCWLQAETTKRPVVITDFDVCRTDKFTRPDSFDIMVDSVCLEVKSSTEKWITADRLEAILNGRRAIINKGDVHEKVSDIMVQVHFVPVEEGLTSHVENQTSLEIVGKFVAEDLVWSSVILPVLSKTRVFITGWLDKKQQITAMTKIFSVQNKSTGASLRTYANILLKESNDPSSLIDALYVLARDSDNER